MLERNGVALRTLDTLAFLALGALVPKINCNMVVFSISGYVVSIQHRENKATQSYRIDCYKRHIPCALSLYCNTASHSTRLR